VAVLQLSRHGKPLMLGVRESGKQTATTRGYFKTFIGKLALKAGSGFRKINSLTSFVNNKISELFSALNKFHHIHYRTKNPHQGTSFQLVILACFLLGFSLFCGLNLRQVYAEVTQNSSIQIVDIDVLADAIYRAEGGKTKHPYGILKKYKTTTPRQACLNTIKSNLKRYGAAKSTEDFITFMSRSYCPVGAENDPTGLNKYWVKNVSFFYASLRKKSTKSSIKSLTKKGVKDARV
jgi:hypothetical protein